jgi:general secretion pathway protein E/type IV pilus assembly protein PilB
LRRARLKIQSNMVISEHRIPQDGRIQTKGGAKLIDLRVSCLPTNHGESIVMRILDKEGLKLGLPELGFFTDDQQTFERLIAMPDGILLVTGPTGSGKTTTLYSCLHYINRPDKKIITVEDPVEYVLAGINQVQVSEQVGLTFATALRAILRQAPNVVMIGEIRDLETASIAINASLTGHLVFSTLHTTSAVATIDRLIDMGAPPYMVAAALHAVLAQRLVRRICADCAEPYTPDANELAWLRSQIGAGTASRVSLAKGAGCGYCNMTGYRGRIAIYELLEINREQADAIRRNDLAEFGRITAARRDYKPLTLSAIELAARGVTTLIEAMGSVSGLDDRPEAVSAPVTAPEKEDPEISPERVQALLG